MNKFLKFMFTFLLVCLAAVVLLVLFIWGTISYSRYSKTQQAIRYKKEVCDTINRVDENFSLALYGFPHKTFKSLDYYIIRQGKVNQKKTVALTAAMSAHEKDVPLTLSFLRKDTLVIAIGSHFYLLHGVGYDARYNYGMTGPVGPCFCESTGFETLNGKPVSGFRMVLEKDSGITHFRLPQSASHAAVL